MESPRDEKEVTTSDETILETIKNLDIRNNNIVNANTQTWRHCDVIITIFLSQVISSSEDEEGYGRWSYTIYGGKNKTTLAITTAYFIYKPNEDIGVFTIHSQ